MKHVARLLAGKPQDPSAWDDQAPAGHLSARGNEVQRRHRRSDLLRAVMLSTFGVLSPILSFAGSGFVKGQVEYIRTHDASHNAAWAPPMFWFTLKGVSAAGSCPTWGSSGTVLFVMNDKQALGFVMTAQATGQEIAVAFEDTRRANSFCTPMYITIGNPSILQ